jgi:hypothetical protein
MLSPLDYTIWTIITLLELGVLLCALRSRSFIRFFPLNFYMLVAVLSDVSRFAILSRYGFSSSNYLYFYYYSDTLLTICLFLALVGLYSEVFKEMGAAIYVRIGAVVVLVLTALVCYLMVRHSQHRLATRFAAELSQNLHFVGAMLTYALWSAVKKLRETRTQLIQFTLSLGVYFSGYAASFAISVLYPNSNFDGFAAYAMGLWLPIAWGYTFLRVPEGARLQTARVAAGAR